MIQLFLIAARNLKRSWFRTTFTVAGAAVALIAFIMLRTVLWAWTVGAEYAAQDRLGTRHKVSFIMQLPKRYITDIRGVAGVKDATYANWFGARVPNQPDEFFANLAVPGAAIQEASLARKMKILPMDDDLVKFLESHGLSRGVIPKGSYKDVVNNDRDIPTIAMANTLVANDKTPADVVYQFTKVLLSDLGGIRMVHPAFKDFDPKDAVKLANVPLHPGAEKAYREAGLLK